MRRIDVKWAIHLLAVLAAVDLAVAEPVRNGNEMALNFSRGDAAARQQIQKDRTGMLHTFRYLEVTGIETNAATGARVLLTVEPSSDMEVKLVVSGELSMKLAGSITTGECVAVKGRVKSIGAEVPDRIVVDPATLQHKDRPEPKAGAELLHEVNPRAH